MLRILRWTLIVCLATLLLLLLLLLFVWWGVNRQPAFYKNMQVSNIDRARENSLSMTRKIVGARNDLSRPEAHDWVMQFNEFELNHWLEIDCKEKYPGLFAHRVRDPRGTIRENKITCGAMLDVKHWGYRYEGIVSVDFLPEMHGPNQFRFKIFNIRMGIVPLPLSLAMTIIQEMAEDRAMDVKWTQEDGYHVLEVDLQPGMMRHGTRNITVKKLDIGHGKIAIHGHIDAKAEE